MSETGTLQEALQVAVDPSAAPAVPVDSGYGGFTGAEPPRALQEREAQRNAASTSQPIADPAVLAAIEQARREEKDKVYGRLTESEQRQKEMAEQLATLTREREAAAEQARQEAEDKATAERAKREEEMGAKDLVKEVESRFQQQLASERDERERLAALLDQERNFAQWTQTRQERLAAEDVRNEIAPQMMRFIQGNSPEELEASIGAAKQATAELLAELQAQQAAQWHAQPGVAARGPVAGPMEQQQAYRTFQPQDIKNMSMAEYQQHRNALLSAASQARYNQQG